MCPMIPRFIISIRELHGRDRCQGMDNGFGVLSQPTSGEDAVVSTVAFMDDSGHDQMIEGDMDDSEAIRLETVGDAPRQV